MASIPELLDRWTSAGLLDSAHAERILAFEAARIQEHRGDGSQRGATSADRPSVLEAFTYLGIIVAAVGAIVLIGQNWDVLESWARIVAVGAPAIGFLLAGFGLLRFRDPGLQRGGQLSLVAALALIAATIAVIMNETGAFDGSDTRTPVLLLAIATLGVSAALWAVVPSHPQVFGMAASAMFVCQALADWPDDFSNALAGIVAVSIAAICLGLAEFGLLAPRASVRVAFALLGCAGALQARFDSAIGFEFLIFAVGAALIALAVLRGSFTYMVFGVLAVFAGLVWFIFEHFSEDLGAPVALILSGALTLAGVVILAQSRRFYRHRSAYA